MSRAQPMRSCAIPHSGGLFDSASMKVTQEPKRNTGLAAHPPPAFSVLSVLAFSTHSRCTFASYAERSDERVAGVTTTPTPPEAATPCGHKKRSPLAVGYKLGTSWVLQGKVQATCTAGSSHSNSPSSCGLAQDTLPQATAVLIWRQFGMPHSCSQSFCTPLIGSCLCCHHRQAATLAPASPRLEYADPAPASAQRPCPPAAGRRCTSSRRSPPRRRRLS
jgi:hypothetical protein